MTYDDVLLYMALCLRIHNTDAALTKLASELYAKQMVLLEQEPRAFHFTAMVKASSQPRLFVELVLQGVGATGSSRPCN